MQFKKDAPLYSYEVQREGGEDILYINYLGAPFVPSLMDSGKVMERTVDVLMENPNVSRIIFVQQKNYNYDFTETSLLLEIASLYVYLLKQEKVLSQEKLVTNYEQFFAKRYNDIFYFLFLLKQDPVASYHDLKKIIVEANLLLEKLDPSFDIDQKNYIMLLNKILKLLERTRLIQILMPFMKDYSQGSREIYRKVFKPDIVPNFTFTRLVSDMPYDGEIMDQYKISSGIYDESLVTIIRVKDEPKFLYHVTPPENVLSEAHNMLLNLARNVLLEHQPRAEEFTDAERTRQVFFNISKDLLQDLANSKNVKINYQELNKLATILVRHTIGFGVIEVLLQDTKLQDIVLNAPISLTNIFVRHQDYEECSTNVLPSQEDADSWAAKFRLISGRPLDEANPILDTQLEIGNVNARIAIIQTPLSPKGLAYAIRRHREDPWTLPLFIKNKMINSFAAGLLSFLIDGSRTILVAGTRSSGKCVDGNTLIQMADGRIEKIKNLQGDFKRKIDDGNIYEPAENSGVFSLGGMNIRPKKVNEFWKRTSPKKVVKIKMQSGKEIITTKEHPYPVYDSDDLEIKYVQSDKLSIGDLIASPRIINTQGRDISFNLKDKEYCIGEEKDFYILKGKTSSSIVRFPKYLTKELAEFVGLVIGDGHIDATKLEFHNGCKELRENYISLIRMFGVSYRIFNSHTTTVVQVSSRVLSKVLNEIFGIPLGKKADKISIPKVILKSRNNILAAFLRGYFDTDGYCSLRSRDLEIVTASRKMSEELQLAFLRFGIIAFKKTKMINAVPYYRILVRAEFAGTFFREIGFSHPLKKERAELMLSKSYVENTNTDVIAGGNRILKNLRKTFRISPKQHRKSGKDYWAYENNQYRVSRKWFGNLVGFYTERYKFLRSMSEKVKILRNIAEFDMKDYFSKIEKIRIASGLSYGSIAHQTGLSERGVKKILVNQRTGSLEVLNKFSGILELSAESIVVNSFLAGTILAELRNELNISNEELASCGISTATVTNIFNSKQGVRFEVLQKIARKTIKIYESAVSKDSFTLLLKAKNLATSDIFWDKIASIEEIDKIDDYVYDLTVEDTHNFIANGLIAHNTSLLGSLMLEILPKFRTIVIEDTLELPVDSMRKLNYDILRMKVRSALLRTTTEVSADDGIRTSLRLGDSCLIVGEVRSAEAKALYEAMRVGALANVVAGTIHGASPYAVFDRVVNDLGVPVTSFKATDIIIVVNPIKSPDGLHSWKRMISVTEVRKHWTKDPLTEKGFVDLLRYNVETDTLEPTEDLINGDSEILKEIASNVKGWAGNWDAIYDNILLRAKIKEEIVKAAEISGEDSLLESKFSVLANDVFHRISDEVIQEVGLPISERIFPLWKEWLDKKVKEKKQLRGEE